MPDFVKLAEAFGLKGMIVQDRANLADAIQEMLAHKGPVLLDAQVSRNENCYPMVAPGRSTAHMLGIPEPSLGKAGELV